MTFVFGQYPNLEGPASVQVVRMERARESYTLLTGLPYSPETTLGALCGPVVSARVGDIRDGTSGDLKSFDYGVFALLVRSRPGPELLDDAAWATALQSNAGHNQRLRGGGQ